MYAAKICMFPTLTAGKKAGKKECAELSQHSFDLRAKRDDHLRNLWTSETLLLRLVAGLSRLAMLCIFFAWTVSSFGSSRHPGFEVEWFDGVFRN